MEIIIAALIMLLAVKEYLSFRERKDVMDRLMAKNLPEFKDNIKEEENKLETDDEMTIEDQKGEILNEQED